MVSARNAVIGSSTCDSPKEASKSGVLSWPRGTGAKSSPPPTDLERERAIVEQFAKRLSVKRLGVTFMFEIGFTLPDKERAALVANAVANAYVDDQLQAKYEVAARAGTWLQDRLKELGKQTSAAERAVVDFRIKNNIVDQQVRCVNLGKAQVGIGMVTRGKLAPGSGGADAVAEHEQVSEVYYVIEGSATLLTGPDLMGAKPRPSTTVTRPTMPDTLAKPLVAVRGVAEAGRGTLRWAHTGTAGVVARPPLLFLAALLLGFAADRLLPLPFTVPGGDPVRWTVAGCLILTGLALAAAGIRPRWPAPRAARAPCSGPGPGSGERPEPR